MPPVMSGLSIEIEDRKRSRLAADIWRIQTEFVSEQLSLCDGQEGTLITEMAERACPEW